MAKKTDKPKGSAPPPVVVIPPLLIPSRIMTLLCRRLRRSGRTVYRFRYRSWGKDIPDNAAVLAEYLRSLGEDELDIVAFSLGCVLVRWAANHHDIPRLRHCVFLGAPNRGAWMADWLDRRMRFLFPVFWGRCARQLRTGDRGLCARAGQLPPETRVGIIAGGTGRDRGFNPLIHADNDLTVAVRETVMPGMSDFALVRSHHSGLVLFRRPAELTLRFLEQGRFRERRPAH